MKYILYIYFIYILKLEYTINIKILTTKIKIDENLVMLGWSCHEEYEWMTIF